MSARDRDDGEGALDTAWERLEDGDVEGARSAAARLPADDPEVLLLRAACAREEGKDEEALALLEQAATLDREWATPEIWAAELLAMNPERMREALAHAERAVDRSDDEDEFLEAVVLKAGLEVDLGKTEAARKTLAALPPADQVSGDPEWALETAHLFLAVNDGAEARRRLQLMVDADPSNGDAHYGLGLAAEALGDEEGKRTSWSRSLRIDEMRPIEDPLLSEAEMEKVAEDALGELPERARNLIANVPIVLTDLPSREDVAAGLDPRLLGLFEGSPYSEGSGSGLGGQPHLTRVLLFRKNLERAAADVEELREEIRTTLLHETGHFFGMSEEDLAAVGLD